MNMDPIWNKEAERVIPVAAPFIGAEETEAVRDLVASGWISQGHKVAEFEEVFAKSMVQLAIRGPLLYILLWLRVMSRKAMKWSCQTSPW